MNALDREQFLALALRQTKLEEALAQLRAEFRALALRTEVPVEAAVEMPPLPVSKELPRIAPPPLPEVRALVEEPVVSVVPPVHPEVPAALVDEPVIAPVIPVFKEAVEKANEPAVVKTPLPKIPAMPQPESRDEDKKGAIEFQFGRWLARIGVVFALITLISFSTLAYKEFHHLMGPWSKLTVLALISAGLVAAGLRIERKNPSLTVYGRTLAGGGLACLYYTIYGATYVATLRVIDSPVLGGILLLAWSGYVLFLAERKKSELLSVFAIALAYFSSAITPVGGFTMAANLILSVTAVIFMVRNAWTGLSYLCLVGTYFGSLRQLVAYNGSSDFWFDAARGVSFWPNATYLVGAWVIYTAGIFLSRAPNFAAGKRMAFLCLNNGALIGLLALAAQESAFGHVGAILCVTGGVFLGTWYLATRIRGDADEVAGAYLIQGLILVTGGIVIAYTGVTRGLVITVESVFLAAAGAFARNAIMRWGAYISSFLGGAFLLNEIEMKAAHPWVLIIGGSIAMLANAWLARREFWKEAREVAVERFCGGSAYYVLLATGLLGFGLFRSPLSETWIAPVIALVVLLLTFSVYLVPLFELPVLIQVLLGFAFWKTANPLNGSLAWWSELLVGLVTMILTAWWPRQKIIRTKDWLQPLLSVYALAMVGISVCAVHPHVTAQGWMISASLLSFGFLLYGLFTRTWPFAIAGQILLAASLNDFFGPFTNGFPWTWWAAAIPVAVTFATAWVVQEWMRRTDELPANGDARRLLRVLVCVYQGLTVALIVRLVFGLVPDADVPLNFYALGTLLMAWNIKWPSPMGVRCAMALDLFGTFDYLSQVFFTAGNSATWSNAAGLILLLAQPGILRRWGSALVSRLEMSGVTFLANVSTSLYVYWVIHPRVDAQGWMVAAALLSIVYLAYGVWTRTWQFMLSGQVYLVMATWTFFCPPGAFGSFPWAWWAAALPPAVFFLTGWLGRRWLPCHVAIPESVRKSFNAIAYGYQLFALGLAVRWIFGIVPNGEITLALFLLATFLLIWNLRWPSAIGVRAALAVSLIGGANYLVPLEPVHFTWSNAGAFLLFLAQPALLRQWGRKLISHVESWVLIVVSSAMAWIFVSVSIDEAGSHNLTLGWALFALVLTLIGFCANERRQRWCGLAILLAAIIRVGVYDFWGFSDLYKVLTFFALTVICLGLSFLYYKFADRLKKWL